MKADIVVKLIEEMVSLKIQQQAEANLRPNAELARLLHDKRQTDQRRLEQIRAELVRLIDMGL
jgi:hypothetical protein